MGTKSNIRSFRFSDEVAGILEAYKGGSLNEKFENLILHCFWEGKRIDAQLAEKRKEYDRLCKSVQDKRTELMEFETLLSDKKRISGAISRLMLDIVGYNERMNKAVTQSAPELQSPAPEKCVTKPARVKV